MNDIITDTATWGTLIGLLSPLLVAFVQQPWWSNQYRQIVAVGVSALLGILTVVASGTFDVQNWLLTLVAVIGAAQTSYALVWKPTKVAKVIELKTSSGQQPPSSGMAA